MLSFRDWLKAWRGAFYWADAHKLYHFNREVNGKKTEVMMVFPLPNKWYGLGLIRCSEDAD